MKKFLIIILILLLIFSLFIFLNLKTSQEKNTLTLEINNHTFILEKAITQEQKQQGLMFRRFMPENRGMIFIFNEEEERSFWMKNTLIPLDIIFIDENYKITSIQTAQPCINDPCQTYQASARYVIELNAGVAKKIGLKAEYIMQLNNL